MQLIRGLHNLRPQHHGCVMTIGNFDGVHLGHRALISRVRALAEATGLPSLVMTFEPMPSEFFAGAKAPPRLSSLREKLELLAETGVDRVLVLRFNADIAATTADQMVENLLIQKLGARHVVVGDDFRFGKDRVGDIALLQSFAKADKFAAEAMASVEADGQRVSSTAVRQLLGEGRPDAAAELLGRSYALTGRVRHGDKIGRTLGVPTANLRCREKRALRHGVYVVAVDVDGTGARPAVANFGRRPTVGGDETRLEVHLLNYDGDLYGRRITVRFLKYQRAEMRFEDRDALKAQMHEDIRLAESDYRKLSEGG